MIVRDKMTIKGRDFYYYYSDGNKKIRKKGTDEVFDEVFDVLPCRYHYEETDIDITPLALNKN